MNHIAFCGLQFAQGHCVSLEERQLRHSHYEAHFKASCWTVLFLEGRTLNARQDSSIRPVLELTTSNEVRVRFFTIAYYWCLLSSHKLLNRLADIVYNAGATDWCKQCSMSHCPIWEKSHWAQQISNVSFVVWQEATYAYNAIISIVRKSCSRN